MSIVSALTLKTTTFINSFLLGLFLKDLLSVLLKEAIEKASGYQSLSPKAGLTSIRSINNSHRSSHCRKSPSLRKDLRMSS